jgi:hypothetical protein
MLRPQHSRQVVKRLLRQKSPSIRSAPIRSMALLIDASGLSPIAD